MPWEIRKEGSGKFCVYKKGTDEKSGCHPTREAATKQLRALYANEPNMKSKAEKLDSIEVIDQAGQQHHLLVEVATDSASRVQGLSGRDSLDCDGMLFDFEAMSVVPMTAGAMKFPILVQWFDEAGRNVGQQRMEPGQRGPFWPDSQARYALETRPDAPVFANLVVGPGR